MDAGVYQIVMYLRRPLTVAVGRLGRVTLPAGWLVYTGSARRGLTARVARHLRRNKPPRWHVDTLTNHPAVALQAAWCYPASDGAPAPGECELQRATAALPGARVPVPGFGATDCAEGCGAHLLAFSAPPPLPPPGLALARVERGSVASWPARRRSIRVVATEEL